MNKPDIETSQTELDTILFSIAVDHVIDVNAVTKALIDCRHVLIFCKDQQDLLDDIMDDLSKNDTPICVIQNMFKSKTWNALLKITGRK